MRNMFTIMTAVLIILLNIGCDQATKNYAKKHFIGRQTIHVAGDLVEISYAENNGGFLSLGSNIPQPYRKILLIIFPVIVMGLAIIYLVADRNLSFGEFFCACCIMGGGISNISDRILHNGFVTDFLNFGIGNIRTGILNFADMSVFFGVIFLFVFNLAKKPRQPAEGHTDASEIDSKSI